MESDCDAAWGLIVAAARAAPDVAYRNEPAAFAVLDGTTLRSAALTDPSTVLVWSPGVGWESRMPSADERKAALDLYLPICSATAARPMTVGHLGQSLDGFIATHAGESRWVTGEENMRHMHRLRALCDAVVVGSGTVAADDPQLTTRLVAGPNPLRVVLDPARRLEASHRVFSDSSAETLYVCDRSLT